MVPDFARAQRQAFRIVRCVGHLSRSFQESKNMILVQLLMLPADLVCDHLGLTDEHERGMMRMLVNMCLFSGVCVVVFLVLWKMLA
jgi:hypothetical protein